MAESIDPAMLMYTVYLFTIISSLPLSLERAVFIEASVWDDQISCFVRRSLNASLGIWSIWEDGQFGKMAWTVSLELFSISR